MRGIHVSRVERGVGERMLMGGTKKLAVLTSCTFVDHLKALILLKRRRYEFDIREAVNKKGIGSDQDESIILTIKKILGLSSYLPLTALTKEDLIARALASEKAIANNEIMTLDELEKEMQNW